MSGDRLQVSDEELALAAIEFVKIDLLSRAKRKERNTFATSSPCLQHDEFMNNCFVGFKLHRLFSSDEFCVRCLMVQEKSKEVRRYASQRVGKLRRLRTLVRKRTEGINESATAREI